MDRQDVSLSASGDLRERPELYAHGGATPETPFSILVLGSFGGANDPGPHADRDWRPIRITPDNAFRLADLHPRVEVPGGDAGPIELRFETLEDFAPDRIFRTHPAFADLRETRAALLRGDVPDAGAPSPDTTEGPPDRSDRTAVDPAGGSLLTDVLEATASRPDPVDAPDGIDPEVRRLARDAVRRHAVDAVADRSHELAELDGRASDLMRRILQDPRVRELESLWRSVSFLLSRSDSTGKVRVYLGDVSTDDLVRDAGPVRSHDRSRLARLVMAPEPAPPAGRWAIVVGAHRVDEPEAFGWLAHVGRVARAADVPWIGAAGLQLAGVSRDTGEPFAEPVGEEAASAWTSMRRESWAPWVMLACPSFLARAPYGPDSERSTRAFDFRELDLSGEGERGPNSWRSRLQWANPAFACAASLGAAFARGGWELDPASELDHLGVPIASVPDGDPVVVETRLSPDGATAAIRAGLVPLLAFPREARVRVGGFRSIALAQGAPAGWWR